MVAITIDPQQMRKLERAVEHIKNGVPKVLVPSINRALNKGRSVIKREIRDAYVIKAKDIPIKRKAAYHGMARGIGGSLEVRDTMMFLDKFFTRGGVKRRPLFARVKVGGGGNISYGFKWDSRTYKRAGQERLPIKRLYAISAPIMASQPTVGPEVNKAMGDALAKNIDQQIRRVLAGAGGHS
jgi:hypothetical protein